MSDKESSVWLQSFHSNRKDLKSPRKNDKAKIICITGAKGGVGKTSVALKLSLELACCGKKILLIDCDWNLSNTAIKLGLPLNDSFLKLLNSEISFEDALYKRGNFHLLSSCNGSFDLFEHEYPFENYWESFVNNQRENYDYIILDSPSGITSQTAFLASYCDKRIFVLNPDCSSITDAYSLIKIIRHKFAIKENFLVVNKVQNKKQFDRVIKTVSETAESYLNVRTHILGGLGLCTGKHEDFDRQFFYGKKNLLNDNFKLILKKFLEKTDRKGSSANKTFHQGGICHQFQESLKL